MTNELPALFKKNKKSPEGGGLGRTPTCNINQKLKCIYKERDIDHDLHNKGKHMKNQE